MPPTRKRKSITPNEGEDEAAPSLVQDNPSKRRSKVESTSIVESSALNYFKHQQYGSKGIRKQLKQHVNLDARLDTDEYEKFYSSYLKSLKMKNSLIATSTITILPEELSNHLLWLGLSNHNILIYGFGSLAKVLRDYAEEYLEGEDVLEILGNPFSSSNLLEVSTSTWTKNVRSLLDSIVINVLKDSKFNATISDLPIASACRMLCGNVILLYLLRCLTFASADRLNAHYGRTGEKLVVGDGTVLSSSANTALGPAKPPTRRSLARQPSANSEGKGKWAYNQSKLYLIVQDICGHSFHSSEAQECLSILAACESTTMIATTSSMNSHLLWSSLTAFRYAWRYIRVNTFLHHSIPTDHILFLTTTTASGVVVKETTGEALIPVLRSLAKRHIEFLIAIANTYIRAKSQNAHEKYHLGVIGSYIIFPFTEAADIALAGLIVKSKGELLTLIKEFIDHNILTHEIMEKKGEFLKFLISEQDLRMIILRFSNSS